MAEKLLGGATFDPLMALSYARTAIDDPDGLPEDEYDALEAVPVTIDVPSRLVPRVEQRAAYALDRIDEAMAALDYDGGQGNDNRNEAAWVAKNIAQLCESFQCEMAAEASYVAADTDDTEAADAYSAASYEAMQAAAALMRAYERLAK